METRSKKINIIIKKSQKSKSQAINIVEFFQKSNYKFASSISYKQVKTSFQADHRSIKKHSAKKKKKYKEADRVAGRRRRRRRSIPAIPAASPQTEQTEDNPVGNICDSE